MLARTFQDLATNQAGHIETLLAWQRSYTEKLERANALREAEVTIALACSRYPGDDLAGHPVLAAAALLAAMSNRTSAADDALLALAHDLRDPLADAVDALLG